MMKIKKAKGIQHSVEGYVCACVVVAGCSCSSTCGSCGCVVDELTMAVNLSTNAVTNNSAQQSSAGAMQNGREYN